MDSKLSFIPVQCKSKVTLFNVKYSINQSISFYNITFRGIQLNAINSIKRIAYVQYSLKLNGETS